VIKGSRVVALVALALSLVSATLFVVGVNGDPHEGPFWLAFFALLWPVFLCPLSCLSVAVWLLLERQQPLARRLVTLAIAVSAAILPWLPGVISLKLWLSPQRALRDSSPTVRSRGAEALGKGSGPEVVAALAGALKDPDDDVRLNASVGLWNQGPEATTAVPALLDALDDPVFGVRGWAMDELSRMPETAPRVVPHLVEVLAKRMEDRSNAIDALFWFGGDAAPAVPALREVLSNGQWFERRRAARTLGAIGTEARSCVPELRLQLRDEHEALREGGQSRARLVGRNRRLAAIGCRQLARAHILSQGLAGHAVLDRLPHHEREPALRVLQGPGEETPARRQAGSRDRLVARPTAHQRPLVSPVSPQVVDRIVGGWGTDREPECRYVVAGDPPRSAAASPGRLCLSRMSRLRAL